MSRVALNPRRISDGRSENVKVFIRFRPVSKKEAAAKDRVCVEPIGPNRVVAVSGPAHKQHATKYEFDGVFGSDTGQAEVYDACVRPYVDEILQGYSCVVFAYGQTGTGKTYTMQGTYGQNRGNTDGYGMIPRVSEDIITRLKAMNVEFSLRASCIELYNEELKDLLSVPGNEKPVKIQDSGEARGEVLMNVEEVPVTNVEQIYNTLLKAMSRRATAHTGMNDRSSRSHALFSLKVHIKEVDPVTGEYRVKIGQLNLVDLAGSECSSDAKSRGQRAKEAKNINRSLVTLGRVITALVKDDRYVPYRDSKLTRLLKESLGGKARTCIIATVSPCAAAVKESKNTLVYAQNAKEIRNRPVQNCQLSHATVVRNLELEISTLKKTLKMQIAKDGIVMDRSQYNAMKTEVRDLRAQLAEKSAALAEAHSETEALRSASQEELEGVRATWEAVSGDVVASGADGVPSIKALADALAEAQSRIATLETERDDAITDKQAAINRVEAAQKEVGKQGSHMTSLEDQVAVLSKANARLEAQVADLTANLSSVQINESAANQQNSAKANVFQTMLASLEQVIKTARCDMDKASSVVATDGSAVPRDEMKVTPTRRVDFTQENEAPASNQRRVSQEGQKIFSVATSSSPLKYGGQPVEHVPATPLAFTSRKTTDSTGQSHSRLKKILSLTAEYKSSRVQELRKSAKVTRSQSLDGPLRERTSVEGRLKMRPSGAFATRRNSAR